MSPFTHGCDQNDDDQRGEGVSNDEAQEDSSKHHADTPGNAGFLLWRTRDANCDRM